MSNQRKNERVSCLVPIDGRGGSVFDDTRTVDFSKQGLGFVSRHRIPLKTEIPIEIELTDDGQSAFVIGRVQWVRRIDKTDKYRVGLSFTDVFRGSKSRLDRYFKEIN